MAQAGILESLAVIFGIAAAAGLITYGVYTARLARHDRRMADSFTGDCLSVPPEGEWTGRRSLAGAGEARHTASPSYDVRTRHDGGL